MSRKLYIYFDDAEFCDAPVRLGELYAEPIRGKEVFSFAFDPSWIKNPCCKMLDPDLHLFKGFQYLDEGKSDFGIFMDSSPDRWGRVLLDRRESMMARTEQRTIRPLMESDYLTGVYDESRMGALRIKDDEKGEFLDNDVNYSAPPFSSIRKLEYASMELEKNEGTEGNKWLKMLIAPGSSLGGARPKANVKDESGHLWIAKFPSRNDKYNIGGWEAVCTTMAKECGISVSEFTARKFNSNNHTYICKRFDRREDNRRRHFTSAMTMLSYNDGAAGVSYLELAEWICRNCCNVKRNLQELFRRIVFNIAISNCDDHLRNHGFLLSRQGWELSPAYDINPDPHGTGLSLNITENDNRLDIELAKEIAPFIEISPTEADMIINHTAKVVARWRHIASVYHIPREEQDRMERAFMRL